MLNLSLYIPTNYLKDPTAKAVFLAGPIQGSKDWQSKAIRIIHKIKPKVIIFSPRRKYLDGEFDYNEQVDWETYHLNVAGKRGVILFWLAKESKHDCSRSYAQTTRAELFEWKVRYEEDKAKIVIGIEKGFSGERYIRRRFAQDCPKVEVFNSLEQTCKKALQML